MIKTKSNLTMFTRNFNIISRRLTVNGLSRQCRFNSTSSEAEQVPANPDPAPLFFNNEVQSLLKTLTRPDPKKVFRPRKDGQKVLDPKYEFMTEEQLESAMKKAEARLIEKLQMPPVLKERPEITSVLSRDPELQGHDNCKYVFTDISFGVNNSDRLIVVRDEDGKLRDADWDTRFRMNQIYFPSEGRELTTPKMFQKEYLEDIMMRQEYEYILDRACVQFEPNDPEYISITNLVYDRVSSESCFDLLRSTRHFGPLVFSLVLKKNIDSLLLENIQKGLIDDATLLIKLFHKIHPSSKSAGAVGNESDKVGVVQKYIELDSATRGKLQAALETYKELEIAEKKVKEGINKAHGNL